MAAILNGGLGYHTIFKGDHPSTIPVKFGLIWFSGVREDLNVIFLSKYA